MKIFNLLGDVQDAGVRLALIDAAFQHGIKIWPKNIEGGTRVDVIILQGDDDRIQRFYQLVKSRNILLNKRGDNNYETTELKDYNGPVSDWTDNMIGFMVEQLNKGAGEYFRMKDALEKILKRLDGMK